MNTSLVTKAEKFLLHMKGRWPTVQEKTGVQREWMAKFMAKKIGDPGVKKLEALMSYANEIGWIDEDEKVA